MLASILFFVLTMKTFWTTCMQVSIESSPFSEYAVFVTRYHGCISRPLFPSTIPYFAPPTRYLVLHRSSDITSALHLQGACTRRGVGVALYTITRESMTSPGTEDRKSILREKDTSRLPVLSWIDRYIDALALVALESVDLSSPIVLLPRGS